MLAGVYRLAKFYVAYQPAPELVWLVVDRALAEAQEADDRHAIRECDKTAPTGAPVRTLCGETHGRPPPPNDADWLWRTCTLCWDETCQLVGIRPPK